MSDTARTEAFERQYAVAYERNDKRQMGDVLKRWHPLGLSSGLPLRRVSRVSKTRQRIFAEANGQFRVENEEEAEDIEVGDVTALRGRPRLYRVTGKGNGDLTLEAVANG